MHDIVDWLRAPATIYIGLAGVPIYGVNFSRTFNALRVDHVVEHCSLQLSASA